MGVDMIDLRQGDCLELMKDIPDGSVDMVLTDMPYGTTQCKWDTVVDLDALWVEVKRITKPSAAIVMTASQPFTTTLIASDLKNFRYCWVWEKSHQSGFAMANKRVMKYHEDIVVFYREQCQYNPIKWQGKPNHSTGVANGKRSNNSVHNPNLLQKDDYSGLKHPKSVIKINNPRIKGQHPTQKPVALMEYLIKTYTNEQDVVIDMFMGSGSTGVACVNTNRKFIGIELDKDYFEIAKERINKSKELHNEISSITSTLR